MSKQPEYLSLTSLLPLVNNARVALGLKRFTSIKSLSCSLFKKKVPYRIDLITGHKLYHVASAIDSLSKLKHNAQPWNRPGTDEEIATREYMPIRQFCKAFRCSQARLSPAITKLRLRAWRHPHTNRLWVHIEQAMSIALYRRANFLYSFLSKAEAEFIIATRPYRTVYRLEDNSTYRIYFAPEYSHLGSKTTAYKER